MVRADITLNQETRSPRAAELSGVREMVSACIQCGTCTGSCPNEFAMDLTPRHLWRLALLEQYDEIFRSKTFLLCSACYTCTLRCPRGLPLTEAMSALKQMAARKDLEQYKTSVQFYKSFMESVRRYGRIHEMEFINHYFFTLKNPVLPLKYAPLGVKLMRKGKLSFQAPAGTKGGLEPIFKKVERMEANP